MVQGGVDGVEMTHFLHPHDQEGQLNCVPGGGGSRRPRRGRPRSAAASRGTRRARRSPFGTVH